MRLSNTEFAMNNIDFDEKAFSPANFVDHFEDLSNIALPFDRHLPMREL
jgi:hypothetical protein